jgi:hypothetical protein
MSIRVPVTLRRLSLRLRLLARSERGMALPTAVFAMLASFGLASAAVLSSVDVQRGTTRDSGAKSAIAAADAGAGVALLRLNRFQESLSVAHPCIGPAGEYQTPSDGWCPATAPESVGKASYSYMVSAYKPEGGLSVIAVGTAGTVSRRINVNLISYNGKEVFLNERLIGQDNIELEGTPDIRTDIGTNGSIEGNTNSTICGKVRHGTGESALEPDGPPTCETQGEVTEGEKNLPPVVLPEDAEISNCRLEANPPTGCSGTDTYSKKHTATRPWDKENRAINIEKNASLTMGGSNYFVCQLLIENGQLIMPAGANVKIYIDTPQSCGLSPGAVQVKITGNASIVSTGFKPSEGRYEVPGIYVLGESSIDLSGTAGNVNELMLYAPYGDITISGSATWIGMFAGKSVRMNGTPRIESDPGMTQPDLVYQTLLERTRYVECTGATASPPDANC